MHILHKAGRIDQIHRQEQDQSVGKRIPLQSREDAKRDTDQTAECRRGECQDQRIGQFLKNLVADGLLREVGGAEIETGKHARDIIEPPLQNRLVESELMVDPIDLLLRCIGVQKARRRVSGHDHGNRENDRDDADDDRDQPEQTFENVFYHNNLRSLPCRLWPAGRRNCCYRRIKGPRIRRVLQPLLLYS